MESLLGGFSFNVTKMSPGTLGEVLHSAPFQEDIVQASSAAVSGRIHIWTIDISEGISKFESKPQILRKAKREMDLTGKKCCFFLANAKAFLLLKTKKCFFFGSFFFAPCFGRCNTLDFEKHNYRL